MRPIDHVLDRLPNAKGSRGQWRAKCLVHHGKSHSSLSIAEGDDGRVLLHCWGGCETEVILRHFGLGFHDLFDEHDWRSPHPKPPENDPDPHYAHYHRAIIREYREQRKLESQIRKHAVAAVADVLSGISIDVSDGLESFGCYAAIIEDLWMANRLGGLPSPGIP